jgi:6-phosphogluconolactonase
VSGDPAGEAAERLAAVASGGGHIALSGGSTPRAAYERAARIAGDWSRATLWFGDDRCVSPDHEHSNYAMVRAAMLDRLAGPVPDIRRVEGERPPADAAALYARALEEAFDGAPELDLALMGLGPDAHTASLFPGDAALGEDDRPCVAVEVPGMAPLVPRVTMTLPVFNAAREVLFLVAGADKAEAVRRAFAGPPAPDAPGSLVRPTPGVLTVLLDEAAASELPERPA